MAKNKSIGWESSKLIAETAKEKIANIKNDPQWIALIIMQFLLVLVLVGAIIIYLDVRFATIEFPFNLIIFAAISYGVLRTYSYTENYRNKKEFQKASSYKIFVYEFAIFLIVLFSTFIYEDPTINLIPYPYNFVTFIVLLIAPVYLYIKEVYWKK